MCIQDSAAEFAGTMDSTAVAAEEQKRLSQLAETDQPGITNSKQPERWGSKSNAAGVKLSLWVSKLKSNM